MLREQTPDESEGYQRLRRLFYEEYEEEMAHWLGFHRYTPDGKLTVTDADLFLKSTLLLMAQECVNRCPLSELAHILYTTCHIYNSQTGKKYSERTLLNKLHKLNDELEINVC